MKITQRSVHELKEHLLYIIRDSNSNYKEFIKPSILLPMKQNLPYLSIKTVNTREKEEENTSN